MNYQSTATQLKEVIDAIASRGWCSATGGNFSARLDLNSCLITASGVDKSRLEAEDFLVCDLNGKVNSTSKKPSAETMLHTTLYGFSRDIGAVLHTHSVPATVLSTHFLDRNSLIFCGYEMQKALQGITSHEDAVKLPILDNDRNILYLAEQLKERWQKDVFSYGFVVRGHGVYAWGKDIKEAKRHLEGIEFLLACELNKMLLEVRQ